MTEYSRREGAFQKGETLYRTGEDALVAHRPDGSRLELAWASIERARLRHAPRRFKRGRMLFTVSAPNGMLIVDNMHYAGGLPGRGRFEARDAEFAAFVADSAARIGVAAPAAGLYLGASAMSWSGQLMLALGGLALAGMAILAFAPGFGGWGLTAILLLAVLAAALPLLVRWAIRARPRRATVASLQNALIR